MKRSSFIVTIAAGMAAAPIAAIADGRLFGVWEINGGEPRPSNRQSFTITRWTFHPKHKLDMRYLPEPPPFIRMASPQSQAEAIAPQQQTYEYIDQGSAIEVVMGSDLVNMKYELRGDDVLLVHMPKTIGGATKIYRRVKS